MKNTPSSQPHGLALLDPHEREREEKRKEKETLAPKGPPPKKRNKGARPETHAAQPKKGHQPHALDHT